MRRPILLAGTAVLVLTLAACSSGGSTPAPSAEPSMAESMMPSEGPPAATIVEVKLTDALKMDPDALAVPVGEPVTFRVTNTGTTEHEFVVGDEAVQDEHEQAMMENDGEMMMDEPNAIHVEPGQSKDLTITFDAAGPTIAGCHIAGHYAAGMKATIDVGS